jgi:hypothetical protein
MGLVDLVVRRRALAPLVASTVAFVLAPMAPAEAATSPTTAVIDAVSCSATTSCMAVGDFGARGLSLSMYWNGTSWSALSPPNPAGTLSSYLASVSCTSPRDCVAVGDYTESGTVYEALSEIWNGKAWSLVAAPQPPGAQLVVLGSVSCGASSACMAVGYYDTTATDELPLVESWTGKSWHIIAGPRPPRGSSLGLAAVSCTTASWCLAAGGYQSVANGNEPYASAWNGKSWDGSELPRPKGATSNMVDSVACASHTDCLAVGYSIASGAQPVLAEHWNGSGWSVLAAPEPSGETYSTLSSVSCTAGDFCVAVGSYGTPEVGAKTLGESWNGKAWSIVETPNPGGSRDSQLEGVSCTSTAGCMAGGSQLHGSSLSLAESWNGKTWSILDTPSSPG